MRVPAGIKAVLFDLDGTLLDRDTSLRYFVSDQYDRWRPQMPHVPKDPFADAFIELDEHGYVWKDTVYQKLIARFVIGGVGWEALLQDYLDHFSLHARPYKGALEVLHQFKEQGIKLGIVTNGKELLQSRGIRALGLDRLMDVILISESEGVRKPDVDIFSRALGRLGVSPEEACFVGDHLENDVAASRRAGMKAAWKRNGHEPEASARTWDACFSHYEELPELLSEL